MVKPKDSPYKIWNVRGYDFPNTIVARKRNNRQIWFDKQTKKKVNYDEMSSWGFIALSYTDDNLPITSIKMSEE